MIVCVALVILYVRPSSRWARRLLLALAIWLWFVSTPLGAQILVAGLGRGFTSLQDRAEARGAEAVVVLGGGATTYSAAGQVVGVLNMPSVLRALEGARVAKLIDARVVIASGGMPRPELQLKPESEMMRAVLISAGIRPDRVIEESSSKTTRDQASLTPAMLAERRLT